MPEPALFVREGDRIVPARPEDSEVAAAYAAFPDKGPVRSGYRLTILARDRPFAAGEEVRVVHVCEAVEPGTQLYLMGPKPVYGEMVDGVLATAPPPSPSAPLGPGGTYDGRVAVGPGVDTNYEITSYRFQTPGVHSIVWQLGPWTSNEMRIVVAS
jgi:hypothetical protein